jgi:hypothetical protein
MMYTITVFRIGIRGFGKGLILLGNLAYFFCLQVISQLLIQQITYIGNCLRIILSVIKVN